MAQGKINTRFRCGYCSYSTDSLEHLNEHNLDQHYCEFCDCRFRLKLHHQCIIRSHFGAGPSKAIVEPHRSDGTPWFIPEMRVFGDTLASYTYTFDTSYETISAAIKSVIDPLVALMKSFIRTHSSIRFRIIVELLLYDQKEQIQRRRTYPSVFNTVSHINLSLEAIDNIVAYLEALYGLMQNELSGLILERVENMKIVFVKRKFNTAKSFIPLPNGHRKKQGVINPKCTDKCFLISCLIALNINAFRVNGLTYLEATGRNKQTLKRLLERESTWKPYISANELKFWDLGYGNDFANLAVFEKANNLSITVFKYCKTTDAFIAIRTCREIQTRHINLLLLCRAHLAKSDRKNYASKQHLAVLADSKRFFSARKRGFVDICRLCGALYRNENHESECNTNGNVKQKFPKEKFYKFTQYHKRVLPAVIATFTLLFSSCSQDKGVHALSVIGYSLFISSCENKREFSKTVICNDSVACIESLLDNLFVNSTSAMERVLDSQYPLRTSSAERAHAKTITKCMSCGKRPSQSNPICINHNHLEEKAEHTYICAQCNLLEYSKRCIYVYCVDINLCAKQILNNVSEDLLKDITIIPKGDKILSITIRRKYILIDFNNHSSFHYFDIFQMLHDSDFPFLSSERLTTVERDAMRKGLSFPSSIVSCVDDLQCGMPSQENFRDFSFNGDIPSHYYSNDMAAFHILRCKNLHDYGVYALRANTVCLSDLLWYYARFCLKQYGLQPITDLSSASYAFSLCHFVSQTNYENLQCPRLHGLLSQTLIGGLSYFTRHLTESNTPRLGMQVENGQEIVEILEMDFNSFYCSVLSSSLAYSDYRQYTEDEVEQFNLQNFNDNADVYLFICCSLEYTQIAKDNSFYFPFAPTKRLLRRSDLTSNIGRIDHLLENSEILGVYQVQMDHNDKSFCWTSNVSLRLYLSLGMKLKAIHHIIAFKTSEHLKPFGDLCTLARKNASNKFQQHIAKTLPNYAFGGYLRSVSNDQIILAAKEEVLVKLCSKPNFSNVIPINSSLAAIALKKRTSLVTHNFIIGCHVLMKSKDILYDYYYNKIIHHWGKNNVQCIAIETDAYYLRITSPIDNFISKLQAFGDYCDFSHIDPNHILYDVSNKYVPLKLKLESVYIFSLIILRSKQRSMVTLSPNKCIEHDASFCKICFEQLVVGARKVKMTHTRFLDVLTKHDSGIVEYTSVTNDGFIVKDSRRVHKMFTVGSSQRIFISLTESYPVGYKHE